MKKLKLATASQFTVKFGDSCGVPQYTCVLFTTKRSKISLTGTILMLVLEELVLKTHVRLLKAGL